MEIKKEKTAEEMHSIVNVCLHDNRSGLPRGMPGTMVCFIITADNGKTEQPKQEPPHKEQPSENKVIADNFLNAATKGNTTSDGNKGKGCGQCWECGERGHPRREREVFVKNNGQRAKSRWIFVSTQRLWEANQSW